jgi:hypothetical protein
MLGNQAVGRGREQHEQTYQVDCRCFIHRGLDGPYRCCGRDEFVRIDRGGGDRCGLDAYGDGLRRQARDEHHRRRLHVRAELVHGLAHAPGKTLVTVKSGTFTVYHAKDCEPMVVRGRGRIRRVAFDCPRWPERDQRYGRARRGVLRCADRGQSADRPAPAGKLPDHLVIVRPPEQLQASCPVVSRADSRQAR